MRNRSAMYRGNIFAAAVLCLIMAAVVAISLFTARPHQAQAPLERNASMSITSDAFFVL